ncbi:MAG: hypothetical protein COB37_10835 [Kordiimonadales bacterium]|nr:MAG: hypothetical protein COB37_10835 [Kordiimonadales bacterium]
MPAKMPERIIYWIATSLMLGLMAFAIVIYPLQYESITAHFEELGYSSYLVYPLAFLKLTAFIVIITNRYRNLKDIAYGAYFLNMVMATAAYLTLGANPVHAYVGLVVIPVSYILSNRVRGEPTRNLFTLSSRSV